MENRTYADLLAEAEAAQEQPAASAENAEYYTPSDSDDDVRSLVQEVVSRGIDIAPGYGDWLNLGFAIESKYRESGLEIYRALSRLHPGVTDRDIELQYEKCLKAHGHGVTIKTLFHLAKQAGVTVSNSKVTKGQVVTMSQSQVKASVPASLLDEDQTPEPLPGFPDSIFDTLPSLLQRVAASVQIPRDRDLVTIGSIVVLSSCMLPVTTIYSGKRIWPNLYLFVPGPAGSGKGRLDLCWRLVEPIHNDFYEQWKEAKKNYKAELADYQRNKRKEGRVPPDKPPISLLRIPGNSSATSFNEALADNDTLLLFESEGDTVVNTFKSDYGNYSDSFRKAYAHESFSYLRRGNDGEYRQIDTPRLSVALSGTPEQLTSLIKDAENGLLSRFMFYSIEADDSWRDGFADNVEGQSLEEYFQSLGEEFHAFYKELMQHESIRFTLTEWQREAFNDEFSATKQDYLAINGGQFSASIHRLAWACLRIAMVLSTLRMMDSGEISDAITCTDADFGTAMAIVKVVNDHNDYVFNMLSPSSGNALKVSNSFKSALRAAILDALPTTFESGMYAGVAKKFGIDARTVRRQIDRAIREKKVEKLARGSFRKV
mgnify:CR=1 FL=1